MAIFVKIIPSKACETIQLLSDTLSIWKSQALEDLLLLTSITLSDININIKLAQKHKFYHYSH